MLRRDFLRAGLGALAGLGFATFENNQLRAYRRMQGDRRLRIQRIERTTVKLPFREVPGRNMAREIPHWVYSEICTVHLASGHVGRGETLLYYTWGATEDEDVKRAQGRNAVELMWDDTLGAGLQMALFDAVARANDVPIHALLGKRVHDKTPLAWWNIDTSPEDMASECKEAMRQGYTAYKTKGRPWFDVWKLIEVGCKGLPKDFKVALDFNDTLLTAEKGMQILKDLAKHPQIKIYETPIFQKDIEGNKAIRKETGIPVAHHYGNPDPFVALKNEICDGFVVGGGARKLMKTGAVSAMADKPFWLQLVGSGVTAAFSLHFGAVLSHATWPAVNCHQLYTHSLLADPIGVKGGYSKIPDGPGLGFDLDMDSIAKFSVKKPPRRPEPPRLIETTWPSGKKMYIANDGTVNFMLRAAQRGRMPYFERGASTRLLPDDGSKKWKELYAKARKGPVIVK